MIVKDYFENKETYTHDNWVYKDVSVGFSRLYYIVDGEAYYEENGKKVRLKKGFLYLTPVKTPFGLSENPSDKLLHTYAHVYTVPAVTEFTEIEVTEGTPLCDAVAMWRKYIGTEDRELAISLIQLVLSFVGRTGRGQGIPRGDHRLPPQSRKIHRHRRQAPPRRAAGRLSRYRQDPAGQGSSR